LTLAIITKEADIDTDYAIQSTIFSTFFEEGACASMK